jgi:hypothetical protein
MAVPTPLPEKEEASSSSPPADQRQDASGTHSIGLEGPAEKAGQEDAENEKGHSTESLYQPHGGKAEDSGSEHSSESHPRPVTRTVSEIHDGIESWRDVEIGEEAERCASGTSERDPNLVTWDGPDDPQNPKLWSFKKKWAAVVVGKQQVSRQTS